MRIPFIANKKNKDDNTPKKTAVLHTTQLQYAPVSVAGVDEGRKLQYDQNSLCPQKYTEGKRTERNNMEQESSEVSLKITAIKTETSAAVCPVRWFHVGASDLVCRCLHSWSRGIILYVSI